MKLRQLPEQVRTFAITERRDLAMTTLQQTDTLIFRSGLDAGETVRPREFSTAAPDVYRFPFPPFPNGWFPVLMSRDVAKGDVRAIHRFGQDLVVYRGESGRANVVGAYCPHMGSHIGFGGAVLGDELRCPFHHWRFSMDGNCVGAFNAKKTPRGKLDTFPVVEKNGAIFVWHDERGREPFWELPDIEETASDDYRLVIGGIYEYRSHPQEAFENQPDVLHLVTLHGYQVERGDWDCDEFSTSLTLEVGGHSTMDSPYSGLVNVKSFGPSLNCSRFAGNVPAVALFMYSPVSAGVVYNPVVFWIHKSVPDDTANAWAKFIVDIYTMDLPIWERKRYVVSPMMTDADGPIAKMRKWYQRWYE
jgi:phenylpropionate dioxygenase-like ring-hydroxylating dioxygenase large terminal subunit